MARVFVSDDRPRQLVEKLVPLLLAAGSVNKLCELINEALAPDGSAKTLYPNRLHALFSEKPNRSLNEASIEAIEKSLDRAPLRALKRQATRLFTEALQRVLDSWPACAGATHPATELARVTQLPNVVVAVALRHHGLVTPVGNNPSQADPAPLESRTSPLVTIVGLVEALHHVKSEELISFGTTLAPILEHLIHISNKYLRMIKAADAG